MVRVLNRQLTPISSSQLIYFLSQIPTYSHHDRPTGVAHGGRERRYASTSPSSSSSSLTLKAQLTSLPRVMSGLQKQLVHRPKHTVPDEPSLLPPNVHRLRRSHLLLRSSAMPHRRLRQNTTEEPVQEADIRGPGDRARSRHQEESHGNVRNLFIFFLLHPHPHRLTYL